MEKSYLKNLYKLSSEILDIQGDDVTLLLGENMGFKSGTLFEIITREKKRVIRDIEDKKRKELYNFYPFIYRLQE